MAEDREVEIVEEEARPRGRPTLYTPELGDAVCAELAMGKTLLRVCRENEEFPADSTIRSWAVNPEHPFSAQYIRAREIGYLVMADETVDIADDGRNDMIADGDGHERVATDVIARSRLRVDTRKWLLSKALPKIYGDKIQAEVTGKDGKDLIPEPSDRDLARAVLDILRTAKVETPDAAG